MNATNDTDRTKKPRIDWADDPEFVETLKSVCGDDALVQATLAYSRDDRIDDFLNAIRKDSENPTEQKMFAALPALTTSLSSSDDGPIECDPKELALEIVHILSGLEEQDAFTFFVEHTGSKRIIMWEGNTSPHSFQQRLKSLPRDSIVGMFVRRRSDFLSFPFPLEKNKALIDLQAFLNKKLFSMERVEQELRATGEYCAAI